MKLETVLYEVKENIARITMNRGEKMNALNHALWDDLLAAFDQAENDPEVRVVILCGVLKDYESAQAGYRPDPWLLPRCGMLPGDAVRHSHCR